MRISSLDIRSKLCFVKSTFYKLQQYFLCMVLLMLPATFALSATFDELDSATNSLSGTYLAARFAKNTHDINSSALYYSKALRSDPENEELLNKSFTQSLANGDIENAIGLAQQVVHKFIDKKNLMAQITLTVDAIQKSQYSVEQLKLNLPNNQTYSANEGYFELTNVLSIAWALQGQNKTDSAIETILNLTGPDWFTFFKEYHIGLILENAERFNEAASHFAIAHDIDRSKQRVLLAHLRGLSRSGNKQQALQVIDRFNQAYPGDPEIALMRKKIEDNLVIKSDIESIQEGVAEIFFGLGAAFEQKGAEEVVAMYLHLALYLNPNLDQANLKLGDLFESLAQNEMAIQYFSSISRDSYFYRLAQRKIGKNYVVLDNFEKARDTLTNLTNLDPFDVESAIILGQSYHSNDQFAEAIKIFSQTIENLNDQLSSQHWTLFYRRGISYERSGYWEEAENDFKTALVLQPDQPLVLNYLGYSWVDRGQNFEIALEMLNKAVQLSPNTGFIVDSLGWVYFKLEQYEDAVMHLERAVELQPYDSELNDHLGDAYWKVGRKLEASFQWSHAKEYNPDPENLEYIVQKLERGYFPKESEELTVNSN